MIKNFAKGGTKLNMQSFIELWRDKLANKAPVARVFFILDKGEKGYLVGDDFLPMMTSVMECHPGLTFLKETPEFQEKYGRPLN